MFRQGDMVQAQPMNGEVPEGTVGQVQTVMSMPGKPRAYKVEWRLKGYPHLKSGWHDQAEIIPLKD